MSPSTTDKPLPLANSTRRHDLDALRAAAMLLGIAYHVSLSFAATPGWPVQDVRASPGFQVFQFLVHGFRMPLFFILSGFFTALLWRRRGLISTLKQRFVRIFVPLCVGTLTIVPLMNWAYLYALNSDDGGGPVGAFAHLWEIVPAGDLVALDRAIDDGFDIDQPHPLYRSSLLFSAVLADDGDVVGGLLDRGADMHARDPFGGTPLHAAAFFGKAESARALIAGGADLDLKDNAGATPSDTAQIDWPTTEGIAKRVQIPVEQRSLEAGRDRILRMFHGQVAETGPEIRGGGSGAPTEEKQAAWAWLFYTPVFGHLWFLAFLCWLTIAFGVYATVSTMLGWHKPPHWLVLSPFGLALWMALTCIPQSSMGSVLGGYGPDTSLGLLPYTHTVLYYALFFFFGALYFDVESARSRLGRSWKWSLPLSLMVLFPFGLSVSVGIFPEWSAWIPNEARRPLAVVTQVAFAWSASIGFMGLFHSLLPHENATLRYISDSSYWLYLVHMPLVFVGQAWVRDWEAPGIRKFCVVACSITVVLLFSYHRLIRYSLVGRVLGGKRSPPRSATP